MQEEPSVWAQGQGLDRSGFMTRLQDLVNVSYRVLKDMGLLWHLVKYEYPTTSFTHFTTVAVVAYKMASVLKKLSESNSKVAELIERVEKNSGIPFEEYCFYTGFIHDYEKLESSPEVKDVDELANRLLEELNVPKSAWELIKQDAKSCEVGVSQLGERHHDLVTKICRVADVLSSVDTVFGVREASSKGDVHRALRLFEEMGIRFGTLHISSHRLLTVLKSKDFINPFKENAWEPLFIYRDGVVFIGTKASINVPLSRISEILEDKVYKAIYSQEIVGNILKRAIPQSFKSFVGYVEEALGEELPLNRDSRRRHLIILANNVARAVRGELGVEEAIKNALDEMEKSTQKSRQSLIQGFQKSLLPANRTPVEDIVKETPLEGIANIVEEAANKIREGRGRTSAISELCYLLAGWSKDSSKVADLYKKIFNENPPHTDLLTLTVAVITKNLQYVEQEDYDELISLYKGGIKAYLSEREEKWRYEVKYQVSSFISGDVVEPMKGEFPKTDKRCILCRSPIFVDEPVQMSRYGKIIGGGKGIQQAWTNDDIPLTDKDKYTQSTEEAAKYTRPVCIMCLYEATAIDNALSQRGEGVSVPFIAVYFRPAVAPEVLSFSASSLKEIRVDLSEIYGVEEGEEESRRRRVRLVLPTNVVPNYLGAFVVISYKECISEDDSGGILKTADLSGRRDQVYYGLLLIPEMAKRTGGGQFKICLSEADLLSPPAKLIELPIGTRFIEGLDEIVRKLQKGVKRRGDSLLRKLYSLSYYYVMRALEGVAARTALWYDHTKVSREKRTATWIIRGIEDVEGLPLPIALLAPPPPGYDKVESKIRRGEDWVYKRLTYRPRFKNVYNIALELESFLSQAQKIIGGGGCA